MHTGLGVVRIPGTVNHIKMNMTSVPTITLVYTVNMVSVSKS